VSEGLRLDLVADSVPLPGLGAEKDSVYEWPVRPEKFGGHALDRAGSGVELAGRPVEGDGDAHRAERVEDVERVAGGEHQKTP
jgi:hypothetical protein